MFRTASTFSIRNDVNNDPDDSEDGGGGGGIDMLCLKYNSNDDNDVGSGGDCEVVVKILCLHLLW